MTDWKLITDTAPMDDVEVMTKIDDGHARNETSLVRQGRLWFFPDRSMYVYYTPTHWHPLDAVSRLSEPETE
jgi:hypothetical protein